MYLGLLDISSLIGLRLTLNSKSPISIFPFLLALAKLCLLREALQYKMSEYLCDHA